MNIKVMPAACLSGRQGRQGFTFIEVAVSVAIVALLAALMAPAFRIFQQQQSVGQAAQGIVSTLRAAQNKTLASEGSSSYGVYFNTGANPQQYVLFKGSTFQTRDSLADETHQIPATIEFSNVNVAGNQVVFDKVTGTTSEPGSVSVRLVFDASQARTIYVEGVGQIGTTPPSAYSDAERIKDSRHAHVDYTGRPINTATESIRLIFPNVTQDIPIQSNMQGGQMYWSGSILAGGQNQVLTIATHVLNDANLHTQFSVHRDMRYNTQPLTIKLTGDTSGTLIAYDANGQVTQGTSIYALPPSIQ